MPQTQKLNFQFVVNQHFSEPYKKLENFFFFDRSGKLIDSEKGFWISNENTELSLGNDKRAQINIQWPHIPTKTKTPSKIMSNSNSFIKFTHTDVRKDAAQTTVPFLDSQDVITNPPSPLQGVGIYYKGLIGFGGFIAPKLSTIDYSSFLKSNLQNFKGRNEL